MKLYIRACLYRRHTSTIYYGIYDTHMVRFNKQTAKNSLVYPCNPNLLPPEARSSPHNKPTACHHYKKRSRVCWSDKTMTVISRGVMGRDMSCDWVSFFFPFLKRFNENPIEDLSRTPLDCDWVSFFKHEV